MALNLAEINRVTLRVCFLPWLKEQMEECGLKPPVDWNPSDDALGRIADRLSNSLQEAEADEWQ